MRPDKDAYTLQIPITFDGKQTKQGISKQRFIITIGLLLLWVVITILSLILAEGKSKITIPLFILIVGLPILRFLVLRERYFKKKRDSMVAQEYSYPHSIFWNIYEISPKYPYICRFMGGAKAVFVRLEKDVIVGKEINNKYNHAESISEAYLQMSKRGVSCIHIDYMDSVGKDQRMGHLFEMVSETENEDLKDLLTLVFDNVNNIMKESYATYDIYAFYFTGREDILWGEIQIILEYFLEANYLRYTVLDKSEIGDLVKTLLNLSNFSVNRASESLFTTSSSTYIRPIWVEKEGRRTVINKTKEEIEEEREVKRVEKEFKRRNKKKRKSYVTKVLEEKEIEVIEESYTDEGYEDDKETEADSEIDLF